MPSKLPAASRSPHEPRADFEGYVDENVDNGFLTNEEGEAFKPRAPA